MKRFFEEMKRLMTTKYTLMAIVAFVLLFLIGLWQEAQAGELEARLGVGTQAYNRAVRGDTVTQEMAISNRDWYASVTRLGDSVTIPVNEWRFVLGYRVDWFEAGPVSPYMTMGAAWWTEPTRLVDDRLTFQMNAGIRFFGVLDIEVQHSSTAGRAWVNTGVDLVTANMVFPIR